MHVATETESDQPLRGSVLHTYAKGKTMPGTNGAPIAPRVVYMVREGVVQLRSRSAVTSFGDERENLTAGPGVTDRVTHGNSQYLEQQSGPSGS